MTVLVTGASGHIGLALVRRLLEQGRRVRALVRDESAQLEELGVDIVQADICDEESLHPAFRAIEVVYHLAGHVSIRMDEWPLLEAVNIRGVRNIIKFCKQYNVLRLVHFSSVEALVDIPLSKPVDETRALVGDDFVLPYARSKAAGHRLVLQAVADGLDAVIICPSAVVGRYDYQMRGANGFLLRVAKGTIPVITEGGYDWVDVHDVIEGSMLAEQHAKSGSAYILSNTWVSLRDLTLMMHEIAGTPIPRVVVPLSIARWFMLPAAVIGHFQNKTPLLTTASLYALGSNHSISHQQATRDLGYQPRPVRETVADTLQWFSETGFIDARRSIET